MVEIPTLKTNAALRSDGSVSRLNIGGLLIFEGTTDIASTVTLSPWTSSEIRGSYVYGPLPSEVTAGLLVAWRSPMDWAGQSRTFYVAANRGRGQIYPDGSVSNLTTWKVPSEIRAGLSM